MRLRQLRSPDLQQFTFCCLWDPEAFWNAFSTHSGPAKEVWIGTLNSMKDECSPLGVATQDQFTIQSLHSAQSFRSDLEGGRMELGGCERVAMKAACMVIET